MIDRICAQYTGTHRCDPPGSVADDMRTLIAEIERLRSALDGPEHEAFADEVASMAAELLRAREALAAADRLAERAYGHWSTHRLAVEYRAARSAS